MIYALLAAVIMLSAPMSHQRLEDHDMQEDDPPQIRDEVPPPCNGQLVYDAILREYRPARRDDMVCV